MSTSLESIKQTIEPLRKQIINHRLYNVIDSLEDLRIFMQSHVYAVWDFMSILKSLQIRLTCVTVPWFPVGRGNTRWLINQIVADEESDADSNGINKSHFEIYLDAMEQCGADITGINKFIKAFKETGDLEKAYKAGNTPAAARNFVNYTFDVINSDAPHRQASSLTFGREDLIPNMFPNIVNEMNQKFPSQISFFKYYLDRHIEVDGGVHSQLALEMTSELCGDNEAYWQAAEQTAKDCLQKRIELWDGVYSDIMAIKKEVVA
jgi:hypothetical protein